MMCLDLTLLLLEACRTGSVTTHRCGITKIKKHSGLSIAERNQLYARENRERILAQKRARYRTAKLDL